MSKGLVFVSGATGFIGSHFVGDLLQGGYSVRAGIRSPEKSQLLQNLYPSSDDTLDFAVVPDITKPSAFKDALKGVDYVYHLASPMVGKAIEIDDYVQPAVDGVLSILNSAKEQGSIKKVVVMSSFVSVMPTDASDNYTVQTNTGIDYFVDLKMDFPEGLGGHFMKYRAGKVLSHQACRDWVKANSPSFPVVTVLPSQVFGPSLVQKTPQDISGVNLLLWATLHGNDLPMTPFITVDVRDVANGLMRIITADVPTGTELPMTGQSYTWKQLADFVKKCYPVLKIPFSPDREPVMTMDTAVTQRLVGMNLRPVEETIRAFLDQQVALSKDQ